jgi:hypothetical protein
MSSIGKFLRIAAAGPWLQDLAEGADGVMRDHLFFIARDDRAEVGLGRRRGPAGSAKQTSGGLRTNKS